MFPFQGLEKLSRILNWHTDLIAAQVAGEELTEDILSWCLRCS